MSEPVRWTPEQLKEHYDRVQRPATGEATTVKAKRPQPQRGVMNKTEAAYAIVLNARREVGEIKDYRFERLTFVIAEKDGKIPAVRYTPDFAVIMPNDKICMVEVKAGRKSKSGSVRPHFEDGARERLIWAAREFPEYDWVLAWQWKGNWEHEVIGCH